MPSVEYTAIAFLDLTSERSTVPYSITQIFKLSPEHISDDTAARLNRDLLDRDSTLARSVAALDRWIENSFGFRGYRLNRTLQRSLNPRPIPVIGKISEYIRAERDAGRLSPTLANELLESGRWSNPAATDYNESLVYAEQMIDALLSRYPYALEQAIEAGRHQRPF